MDYNTSSIWNDTIADTNNSAGIKVYDIVNRTITPTIIPGSIHILYIVIELIVALLAVVGNLLVMIVFVRFRAIRTTTNYYIMSLVTADLLVGLLGIPFAIATSMGLPKNFHACIFMSSLLLLLCTASIFSLVAVSIDRFWAIQWPLTYPFRMTSKVAQIVIAACWSLATVVGLLPSIGWNAGPPAVPRCYFMEVIDMRYLATLYFCTILLPLVVLALVYGAIYHAVSKHVRRMSVRLSSGRLSLSSQTKAAKTVGVIVALFCISWIPLYTYNALVCFCPGCTWIDISDWALNGLIILSHCNSAWNPLLYAWGMRDFRAAFVKLCTGKKYTKFIVVFENSFNRRDGAKMGASMKREISSSVFSKYEDNNTTKQNGQERKPEVRYNNNETEIKTVNKRVSLSRKSCIIEENCEINALTNNCDGRCSDPELSLVCIERKTEPGMDTDSVPDRGRSSVIENMKVTKRSNGMRHEDIDTKLSSLINIDNAVKIVNMEKHAIEDNVLLYTLPVTHHTRAKPDACHNGKQVNRCDTECDKLIYNKSHGSHGSEPGKVVESTMFNKVH